MPIKILSEVKIHSTRQQFVLLSFFAHCKKEKSNEEKHD